MDYRTWIMLATFVICVMIPFINNHIFKTQNNNLEEKLCKNNKQLVFVNNTAMDIKKENYKSKDFFNMHNVGDLNVNDFEYIVYSQKEDYYLNKRRE